jgi:hypothetical protein
VFRRSQFSSDWDAVMTLLESALLRLTGIHEVCGRTECKRVLVASRDGVLIGGEPDHSTVLLGQPLFGL